MRFSNALGAYLQKTAGKNAKIAAKKQGYTKISREFGAQNAQTKSEKSNKARLVLFCGESLCALSI